MSPTGKNSLNRHELTRLLKSVKDQGHHCTRKTFINDKGFAVINIVRAVKKLFDKREDKKRGTRTNRKF